MVQEEETARAKALKGELVWCVRTPARSPGLPGQSEHGGRVTGGRGVRGRASASAHGAMGAMTRTLASALNDMRSHWKVLNKEGIGPASCFTGSL